jgi:two-component sensor histidine kinase
MTGGIDIQTQGGPGASPASAWSTAQNHAALHEENLLMRELTHRMANDWTSAISTLSIAARQTENLDVRTVLANVSKKLFAQAELLRALQIPEDGATVDAAEYLGRLCLAISRARLEGTGIHLIFGADPLTMDADRCWRLGMIVSELVTNSVRHAFGDHRDGAIIRVDLRCDGNHAGCLVSDNGSARPSIRPGHGTAILRELVASIGGMIEQTFGSDGSVSRLCFRA